MIFILFGVHLLCHWFLFRIKWRFFFSFTLADRAAKQRSFITMVFKNLAHNYRCRKTCILITFPSFVNLQVCVCAVCLLIYSFFINEERKKKKRKTWNKRNYSLFAHFGKMNENTFSSLEYNDSCFLMSFFFSSSFSLFLKCLQFVCFTYIF